MLLCNERTYVPVPKYIFKQLNKPKAMNEERFAEILKKFPSKKIAVIGDLGLDVFTSCAISRINPERPAVPLMKKVSERYHLGCAANVAANLAALSAGTSLYGLLGDDFAGRTILDLCHGEKIKAVTYAEGETLVKRRFIEMDHGDTVCRVDEGESDLRPASAAAIDYLLERIQASNADAIIMSDYGKRVFESGISRRIISWANSCQIPTIVDPKPENYENFRDATVINPNISEARRITGMKEESPKEVVKKLKQITQSKYLVVTLGRDGMMSYDGSFHEMPTQAQEVVDVVGAGDTVTATLALSLVSGASIVEAAQLANIAAGIVVEKRGTATTTIEEILERINSSS
jgi:D-glycero-beta-D-manno-heptose-7-phosphate kinase